MLPLQVVILTRTKVNDFCSVGDINKRSAFNKIVMQPKNNVINNVLLLTLFFIGCSTILFKPVDILSLHKFMHSDVGNIP